MNKKLTTLAYAKINLHLQVLGLLPNGYHNISTIFQSVDLFDEVTVEISEGSGVLITTENAVIEGENLAKKAAELFLKAADKAAQIKITLKKNIPLAAGLAGGSADAAAVLSSLNTLFNNTLTTNGLLRLGLNLGADVPFCILGGTALAEGVGEKLTPKPFIGNYQVVLIKHFSKSSTGDMYKRLDSRQSIPTCHTNDIITALGQNNIAAAFEHCTNDFLTVSNNRCEQQAIISSLYENGAVLAGLSGSGPTVFGLFEKVDNSFINKLKSSYNEVYLCSTAKAGIKIVE